jgi:hypothetical protein
VVVYALSALGQAATFHVSPQGSNTPPYDTYATAAHEVADAAAMATGPGDTVLVHAGSYTTTDTTYIALGVTLAGVGRDSVTINWGDTESRPAIMVSLAGENEIFGLEFRNPRGASANPSIGALHAYTGWNIKLHDCRVTAARVYLDGDTWQPGNGVIEVHDNHFDYGQTEALFVGSDTCLIHDNLFTVSNADGSGNGVRAWLVGTVVIQNNRFLADQDPYDNPFTILIEECDTAVVANNLIRNCYMAVEWRESDGVIENNTMIHADPDWYASIAIWQGKNNQVTVRNNAFIDMERAIVLGPEGGVDVAGLTTLVHNIFWPPRDTIYSQGVQSWRAPLVESLNVITYPMFVDDSLYCPQAGSPLIDSGDPAVIDIDSTRSDIGWHGGPGGFMCAYLELPPAPPESLWVDGTDGIVTVTWTTRPESDLSQYHLYRGSTSGFWSPGLPAHRIVEPPDTVVVDTLLSAGDSYYYVVTALDTAGLESEPSFEREYTLTGVFEDEDDPLPRSAGLVRVYPNPFNSSTLIEVDVPADAVKPVTVTAQICDLLGRHIATRQRTIASGGSITIAWDARRDDGRTVSSGVYFLRVSAGDVALNPTVRLVVLK